MAGLSKTGANDAPLGQLLGGDNVSIPLGNKPYAQPYHSMGIEECKNMYVEYSPSTTSVSEYYYVSRPGLRRIIESVSTATCRGLYTTGTGITYGVFGQAVYQINTNNTRSFIGNIATWTGPVKFADNGTQCILVDGQSGYIIEMTSSAMARITDEYFPGVNDPSKAPTSVVCLDTYFIVNEGYSNRYYWSTPGYVPYAFDQDNPDVKNVWWGLQYAEKVADSDNIVGLTKIGSWLYVLGSRSIEIHYNTGDANSTFARYSSAPVNFGCQSANSITKVANIVYFLGLDERGTTGIFQISTDFQPKRVSTRGIEALMAKMPTTNVISYIYAQAGHVFVCYYFPEGDATYVYDAVTDAWHRRTYYDYRDGTEHAWQALYTTQTATSQMICGSRHSDAVYVLDPSYYKDDYATGTNYDLINRVKSTPVQINQARNSRYKMAQILCKAGVGLAVPDALGNGQDPKVLLSYANDAGAIYIPQAGIQIGIGKIGEYDRRCITYGLGIGRNRTWLVVCTEPVEFVLYGLVVSYEELRW